MSVFVPCTPPVGASSWTQITALDGASYVLAFQWNQRDGHWTISVADFNGVPIRSGVVLGTGSVVLAGVVDSRRPPGELVVLDATGANDLDPGFDDLGSRFVIVYVTRAELTA